MNFSAPEVSHPSMNRFFLALALLAGCGSPPPAAPLPALPELRTVETARTTTVAKNASPTADQPAWLGVHVASTPMGVVVVDVAENSPAAQAGLRRADLLLAVGDQEVRDEAGLRDLVHARDPGEKLKLALLREGKELELDVALGAVSRPLRAPERRGLLGVQVGEPGDAEGTPITRLTPGLPAEKAGLKIGDRIVSVDGAPLTAASRLTETLALRGPGDEVVLAVARRGKTDELKLKLVDDPNAQSSGFFRGGSYWKKDVYRLAAILIEYPDVAVNAKIPAAAWEESLFSKDVYRNKSSVTGQPVHGSLNDYWREQSCGAFRVEGKVFAPVKASKNRQDYSPGTGTGNVNRSALLVEALDLLLARDGKDALKDIDGICFVYAGDRVQTSRGGLYWPHRASFTHQGKRWPYFIVQEGGARMNSISVIAHEFGHLLGLPDLYARPENPGSEGLGNWCAMSDQLGAGRPQHLSAWCKEQLGWLKPAVVDPTVLQRIALGPVENSTKECVKVLVRADGSEYLLLENRRKSGFDAGLPAEGLLVWRVVRNRPVLEESHGIEGPSGPRAQPASVPYPSAANDSFTPFTTPSSRSLLGGGLPVHLTQIRRLPDGRVAFTLGAVYD
jgi:M6 family metalloprotease-like protein